MDYKTLLGKLQIIQNVEQNPINMDEVIMFLRTHYQKRFSLPFQQTIYMNCGQKSLIK